MDTNNDSKFIGSFAASLRYWRTGLDPDPNGADRLHVSGCIPQLEIDAVTSFVNKGRTLYQIVYRLPLVKRSFSLITDMVMRNTMIVMAMSHS